MIARRASPASLKGARRAALAQQLPTAFGHTGCKPVHPCTGAANIIAPADTKHLSISSVHAIQSAFSENWVEETGELFVGEDFFPELHHEGDVAVHVARVKPEGSAPAVKILHHLAICCARKRIRIRARIFCRSQRPLRRSAARSRAASTCV